ncbi:MAG TPA: winged helix-turn-helix domain-containing protein [Actinophytocola sp.]|uniref:winged helix-turn-helix domain-containing protein n=1 Tax=Actinophytocola sp. TaxID=1872138 RepID=UPI002DB63F5B|nr:winged helix-turn-helix domain-containing protein [Actinophytocola sp.]HEU5474995.1 winged helix-turn-helix domain-containing protein [Actinophytocola sp.]
MDARGVLDTINVPLVLCVGTSADEIAAIARATGGRVAVLYLPDTNSLRAALSGPELIPSAPPLSDPIPTHRVVEFGKLRLDADLREATWRGSPVPLSAREFDLLFALTRDPGRVWTFAELTTHVWERPYLGDIEAVVSAVKRLRRQLRAAAPGALVESVRGVGYRLVVVDSPDQA